VAASSPVFAAASGSGPASAPCSCRLLSHQTLLWHHRLGHPSLPRLRGMASRVLVSGLPRSLPPLPPGPAPTCVPCVEGRQSAAPHSSEFPPTEAPLQTLHMDVWGPARVRGQGHERYFLLVVDDYSRYTPVFPLRSKGDVAEVLIDWIRAARLQLRESFGSDFPVLRLHSDRGGEFSSARLGAFCRAQGIRQTFTLPTSPQQNGIAERRIGMVMDVARTSMIHAAAPHFLWPFAVQYAAHQLNLQPRVSVPETSPTLRWTGKVGDASAFRVWGSRAFVRDLSADKLSPHAIPCDVTFDVSVPFYRLFSYRTAPLPPPPLFLAPGPPAVDPLPPQGPASSGVSQVDAVEPVEVAVDSGAARGAESGGAEPGGAESGGAEPGVGFFVDALDTVGLMTCTRPDLAYPLSILARYVAPGRHRPEHMAAAKRVLHYLCSTSGLGLVLGGRRPVVVTGHADASWADDLATQRSCEAEIYAGAMAAQELRWLTYLLTDLGEPPRSPPVLYVDNKAMLALCREHRLEHRTKHIALRYFLARELQQRGQLRLAYMASEANTADIFTKALPPGDHQRFCTMLACFALLDWSCNLLFSPTLPMGPTIPATVQPVHDFVTTMQQLWDRTYKRLQGILSSQKRLADRHRRDHTIAVGDHVLLDTCNLKLGHLPSKLRPRFCGPFLVEEQVTPVTFRLRLPASWKIHNAFHVQLLKPYQDPNKLYTGRQPPPPPPVLVNDELEYEVESVLAHRRRRHGALEFLVRWKGYDPSEDSWGDLDFGATILPKGKKLVGVKWVYQVKVKGDGSLDKFKARLVAKGYSQVPGQDYNETFVSVAKYTSVRALLGMAVRMDLYIIQLDVSNAFLYGVLEEEIYTSQLSEVHW
ncbi:unnamed protein product, partial [Closterium sp. NIES-53]